MKVKPIIKSFFALLLAVQLTTPAHALNVKKLIVGAGLVSTQVAGQAQNCLCDTTPTGPVCVTGPSGNTFEGFELTLLDQTLVPDLGVMRYSFQICDRGLESASCPNAKDLSHIDFLLPDMSACVVNPQVTATMNGAACSVDNKDPSCGISNTLTVKCNGNGFTAGQCGVIQIDVAGETTTLGTGLVYTVSKAGPDCASSCLRGPSCDSCEDEELPPGDYAYLTRTIGFWGTHPDITQSHLPQTVCGNPFTTTNPVRDKTSATQALCLSGSETRDKDKLAQAMLIRHLLVTKLNIEATARIPGGNLAGHPIHDAVATCEGLCGQSSTVIQSNPCVNQLDEFNNLADTITTTPAPFNRPGPAAPQKCQQARNDNYLVSQ